MANVSLLEDEIERRGGEVARYAPSRGWGKTALDNFRALPSKPKRLQSPPLRLSRVDEARAKELLQRIDIALTSLDAARRATRKRERKLRLAREKALDGVNQLRRFLTPMVLPLTGEQATRWRTRMKRLGDLKDVLVADLRG